MSKNKLIETCDVCDMPITENGHKDRYKGLCEKHLHLKKIPPAIQGKRGVQDGPNYRAPIFTSHGLPEEANHVGRG